MKINNAQLRAIENHAFGDVIRDKGGNGSLKTALVKLSRKRAVTHRATSGASRQLIAKSGRNSTRYSEKQPAEGIMRLEVLSKTELAPRRVESSQ